MWTSWRCSTTKKQQKYKRHRIKRPVGAWLLHFFYCMPACVCVCACVFLHTPCGLSVCVWMLNAVLGDCSGRDGSSVKEQAFWLAKGANGAGYCRRTNSQSRASDCRFPTKKQDTENDTDANWDGGRETSRHEHCGKINAKQFYPLSGLFPFLALCEKCSLTNTPWCVETNDARYFYRTELLLLLIMIF